LTEDVQYEYITTRVPKEIKDILEELCVVSINGKPVKVATLSQKIREALLRGIVILKGQLQPELMEKTLKTSDE